MAPVASPSTMLGFAGLAEAGARLAAAAGTGLVGVAGLSAGSAA